MALEEAPKKPGKDRHVVVWTQQEDDSLREQIKIHGTENWTAIAAKFKDKTSRQCRRRWYTYLSTECKKGGWSAEEDLILCEAQKVFGNRWTEIAKVVPGRSDNAVKNRFSTLCKKRAKLDDQFKENRSPYINLNSKRTMFHNGCITSGASELTESLKKFRENSKINETFPMEQGNGEGHIRPPLAVLVQNLKNMDGCTTHHDMSRSKAVMNDGAINKGQSTFLKRDDPKITALIQQADFLSNLSIKINSEDSNHSLENAWKELQDFLSQSGMNGSMRFEVDNMDIQFENFKDLMEELRSGDSESWLLKRQFDMHDESQVGSECNGASIATENVTGNHHRDETSLDHYFDFTMDPIVEQCDKSGFSPNSGTEQALSSHDELIGKDGTVSCIEKTTLHCDLDIMMKPSPENDGEAFPAEGARYDFPTP
ncbi:Myb-related protein 3R-1 [Acorus gramineus]|uniref:Myb-related protein 3R-1 n=1 Tax=Acorus gramineus TaxID=55184 RepID=A0AAV9AA40_ACOGR|nr:Myb-related protein 3R-1 [Acorus gramineus]